MAQELTLKTNASPTIFNKDMLLGGLAAAALTGLTGGTVLLGAAIVGGGALVGGFLGEKRMEREATIGKKVGEPSFWNKDTLIGGLLGSVIGSPVLGAIAGIAALAIGVATAGAATPLVVGAAAIAGLAGVVAAPVIGAYVGGRMGETRMANELQDARQQNIVNDLSKSSPAVSQAVEYAMANDKTKNWTQQIENERAMAQNQQPTR